MRVLADESVPRRFARLLMDHEVDTVQEIGWTSLSNGVLLRRAAADGYDAFVTVDQSIPFQQNVAQLNLGVVVLVARSNRFADLEPLLADTLAALAAIEPGTLVHVGG